MWQGHVILVRHGSTSFNSAAHGERVRGWIDLPLAPKADTELGDLQDQLKALPLQHIASSSLQRALATAQAVQQHHPAATFTAHRELRPWHLGIYSGQLVDHVKPYLDHAANHPTQPIPGGESFKQFADRFLPILHAALQDPRLIALVTHYRNIALAMAHLHRQPLNAQGLQWAHAHAPSPGGALHVSPEGVHRLAGHSAASTTKAAS